MPELPEVETTIRELSPKIIGKKIVNFWTDTPKIIKSPSLSIFEEEVLGKKIVGLERKGKNILIRLEGNILLVVHQKLTGHLLYGLWKKEGNNWKPEKEYKELADPYNRFIHIIFFLDDGKMLALSDMRKFAKIAAGKEEDILKEEKINLLGPDPLGKNFTPEKLGEILRKQRRPIKTVLMDQELISGIGNIYSDEALWMAKISPLRKADSLNQEEVKTLCESIKAILKKAIKLQGASIIDYRRPDGSKGKVDSILNVYRKEGQKCPRCGGIIKRVVINGRSAHYCPQCQK